MYQFGYTPFDKYSPHPRADLHLVPVGGGVYRNRYLYPVGYDWSPVILDSLFIIP